MRAVVCGSVESSSFPEKLGFDGHGLSRELKFMECSERVREGWAWNWNWSRRSVDFGRSNWSSMSKDRASS